MMPSAILFINNPVIPYGITTHCKNKGITAFHVNTYKYKKPVNFLSSVPLLS